MEFSNLIRDVIQAAAQLHQRRLWKRFTNFDCFALRLPGKPDPLLACVMGDAGEQYGLTLFQGPHAAEGFAALSGSDALDDDVVEAIDMLGLSMDAFGDLPPEIQTFFRRAGVRPRRDELVPSFIVKPSHRSVRLPNEAELSLFFTVCKAAVAADQTGTLAPATLDDERGICFVTVAGEAANPTVSVTREKLPGLPMAARPAAATGRLPDLSGLKVLEGTWLVGTPLMPGCIEGDDRSMQLLLVAADATSTMLQARSFPSEDIQDAVDALVETFGGHQPDGRKGLPRNIVFSSRKLHDAMVPMLQKVGVACLYLPEIPKLQRIAEEFLAFLGEDASPHASLEEDGPEWDHVPAEDDLAGWKEADCRLSRRFADFLWEGERLWTARAAKRYFDDDDVEHFLQVHENRGVAMAYSTWGVLDYRPSKTSKTQAEKWLAQGLPPAEEMLLRARMAAHPSVYRVAGHDAKAGTVDLEDVLLGGGVTVHDQLLSENIHDSMFLVVRAFPAGRFHLLDVAGPPLGMGMGREAIEFLRHCGLKFTPEGLKREAHKLGWLWGWAEDWQANWKRPRLCNTDGDEMLMHTASFSVADPVKTRQALRQRPDIDPNERGDEFLWSKATGKGAEILGGPVNLGRIEFVGDELVLTVNSANRFETARQWLTELPGVTFINVATQRVDAPDKDRAGDDRIADPEPEITPEMAQTLQAMMDKHYTKWIDTPLPVLGGKTPRQACRTLAGREQVTIQIRTMPDPTGPMPLHVPRQAMLRELGLDAEPLAAPPSLAPRISQPSEPMEPSAPPSDGKVGRNDPCPCGSGKKYKKCCGQ